jgi:PAS domain S-box-containing protein
MRKDFELLREIVDSLPFAALVITSSGSVAWWNKASEQLFGWKSAEVLGGPNPIVPADRQDEFRVFREVVSDGRVLRIKSVRQRKDGAPLAVNATMVPMRNFAGSPKHILILHEPVGAPVFAVRRQVQSSPADQLSSARNHDDEPLSRALSRFTPRQRQIILQVARGCSNREIAKNLSLGEQQIKNYLRSIYREISVGSRAELVSWLNRQ